MNRFRFLPASIVAWLFFALASPGFSADRFDDISVGVLPLAVGETHHGYREFRILLQNHSVKDSHEVRIAFPDYTFSHGNSIRRITRTISLNPASQSVVPIWQPPLPIGGGGNLQVIVDDEMVGRVNVPSAAHMTRAAARYSGSSPSGTILVSRGLNYDDVDRALKPANETGAFTAKMATGAPDSAGRRTGSPTAWMPEVSITGPHWLELTYDTTLTADRVRIYGAMRLFSSGEIIIKGVSGTNLARIPMPPAPGTGSGPRRPPEVFREFSFPITPEPIKTVRVEFGSGPGGSISVDAVEVAGPSGSVWAASGSASSEASGMPGYTAAAPGSSGIEPRELLRAETPVAEWSEQWLSYTPFDAIVLGGADIRTAPSAVLSALWRYAECGGNLILLGTAEVPGTWRESPTVKLEGGRCLSAGFGQCFLAGTERISDLGPASVKTLMNAVAASARYWQGLPDEPNANASFPVVENVRIPIRGTVFIMLMFVIVIGPVNLIVLSRMNRRTWLLWTIPAISVLTCLVVFVFSLLREGITPDSRVEGLTLLDQANHRATSIGCAAFYCPLTPSQGLYFSTDTEATPLIDVGYYRYGRPSAAGQRELDWTQSQHLTRGWVTARVPAHFQLRKSELRRERLQLEESGGTLSVVNGLGADIRSLRLADARGRIYTAADIPVGRKATLTVHAEQTTVSAQTGTGSLIERSVFTAPESIVNGATACLRPGTYIADLATNPFLENALGAKAKAGHTRTRCVVFGLLEPAAQP
jgi:hypothetical protein